MTSTTVLAAFLREHGIEAEFYIPRRLTEGYGLNREAVETIAESGAEVLVTLDCGITAADEIERANQLGMDCIVVDHHKCPPALPPAYAVLNHQQDDCGYPDKVLAAVGVCFNLMIGLRMVLRERGFYEGEPEPNLRRYLDLVALGTIADMVPLLGPNRILAHHGMLEMRRAERPGLRALMEVSKVRPAKVLSGDVAFRLGPRVNAAGRLDDATVGVRLFLSEEMDTARRLAGALDQANGNRQLIEAKVFKRAVQMVEAEPEMPAVLVLHDPSWHPGVVGIVASKLVERFERPAVLIGEGGRGSARTAGGLHLYNALRDVSSHLTKFGGHRAAAGLRIQSERIEAFRNDLVARIENDDGSDAEERPTLRYDSDLSLEGLSLEQVGEVRRLEPFGIGNPEPLFRVTGAPLQAKRIVGKDHLKLRVGSVGAGVSAIAFKQAERFEELEEGAPLDLAAHVEINEFGGSTAVELRIRDLRVVLDR